MNCYNNLNGQRVLSILFFSLLLSSFPSIAHNYSIYLVRHAENLNDAKNSTLTVCGKSRAKQLASLLSKTNITHIYSTHDQRSMQTGNPLASQQKIAIKNYNAKYLEQLTLKLQQYKINTLVVGHNNTIPRLVALLTKKTIVPLSEEDYQQLYQVQYIGEQVVLTIFKQPLSCKKT
jgi:broad specificity phosphatase PhoE